MTRRLKISTLSSELSAWKTAMKSCASMMLTFVPGVLANVGAGIVVSSIDCGTPVLGKVAGYFRAARGATVTSCDDASRFSMKSAPAEPARRDDGST